MREINYIVVHCTATSQKASVESIQKYWREQKGWKFAGYHYLIKSDGTTVKLLSKEQPSNGVRGYNSQSINVAYIGGIDPAGNPKDTRTEEQRASLVFLLEQLRERYPNAIIQGHRDFPKVKKACPSFDAKTEYNTI